MRRASNTPDTMVQYINVVADESLAYDVLKFVDTQDAATTLSLSAESYLETTAGIIIDLEIAGLKGSDDAIRLYPDDTETIYDLATLRHVRSPLASSLAKTRALLDSVFAVISTAYSLGLWLLVEALCQVGVINAIAAGGSGTTLSTTTSGIFPTGTCSYPSGTSVHLTGSGYFPTRPAYPTSNSNSSGSPSGTGGFPSGLGYGLSGTGPPYGLRILPPKQPIRNRLLPPIANVGR